MLSWVSQGGLGREGRLWGILGDTGEYWGVVGHTGGYWEVLGHTGRYWGILWDTRGYWDTLEDTKAHWGDPKHRDHARGGSGPCRTQDTYLRPLHLKGFLSSLQRDPRMSPGCPQAQHSVLSPGEMFLAPARCPQPLHGVPSPSEVSPVPQCLPVCPSTPQCTPVPLSVPQFQWEMGGLG